MFARRLLLLFAMLMLVAALAGQVAPEPQRAPGPAAPAPPQAAREGGDGPRSIEKTLTPEGEGRGLVEASVGDTIRLTVEHDRLASVELRGLDRIETVTPDSPAIFEIYAERAGTFPIVVLESDREFATLEVTP